ncbi:MAG: ribonuclease HIII [Planctomycetes bacterium]|jgi:ribonuclease HIII|nr:ribonuclease HIII [Planctomycetota bacterium]MCL4731077.1 ribonuclease HIII [Planctomycetota bacterium]
MTQFDSYCDRLLARAEAAGWETRARRTIPYGRQFELARGQAVAMLNCYQGKKGLSFVTGGKAAADLGADLGAKPAPKHADAAQADPFGLGLPHAGGDESGKGDYFGPLCVAAWLLEEGHVEKLRALGITDSKKLTDTGMEKLAGQLDKLGRGHVVTVMPREYNGLYARTGNLNTLLSRLHGQCMGALIRKHGAPRAVLIDQFARDSTELRDAMNLPAGTKLVTRTGAEADLAVAAASVLARVAFVAGLKELGHEFGMEFPPGAGEPVLRAGREFRRTFGAGQLPAVAKVHFKTTGQL